MSTSVDDQMETPILIFPDLFDDVPPCVEDPPPPVPQAVIPITIDAARIVAATFFKIFFIRCPPSTLIRICFCNSDYRLPPSLFQ